MRYLIFVAIMMVLLPVADYGQGFAFGAKGGVVMSTQIWRPGGNNRSALFSWNAAAFIETLDEEDAFSLFAQLGYVTKGSAIRYQTFRQGSTGWERVGQATDTYEFRNLELLLGGKQKFGRPNGTKFFYLLGVRAAYNLSNNLTTSADLDNIAQVGLPYSSLTLFDEFVNDFTFGVSVGTGIQFPFSELIGGTLELTVNPDFTKQYNQLGDIENVINPYNPGQPFTIPARQITNVSFELTLGIRFLNKYVYVD